MKPKEKELCVFVGFLFLYDLKKKKIYGKILVTAL